VASYTNFGRVDTTGVDIGLDWLLPEGWQTRFAYSWFDFDARNPPPDLERLLLPNTPAHTVSAGIGYSMRPFDAGLAVRWVDRFRWAVGSFQGDVPAYTTADVTANYRVTRAVTAGLNVANVFDDRHWESFGGDLLGRRALVSVAYGW
jgi:iron complex outermembrane receptor protein